MLLLMMAVLEDIFPLDLCTPSTCHSADTSACISTMNWMQQSGVYRRQKASRLIVVSGELVALSSLAQHCSSFCGLLAPRQIHDAGRPSHVLPMAIHRSVHEAKGVGCGRLQATVVAPGSGGSSASLRKVRRDFIPPRRCQSTPHLVVVALGHRSRPAKQRREGETEQCSPRPRRGTPPSSFVVSFHRHNEQCGQDQHRSVSYYI